VFLTSYPEARKILDYNTLELKAFDSGAVLLRSNGKVDYIGDPQRQLSSLIPTLTTTAASFGDKLKIIKTKNAIVEKSIQEIFSSEEMSTMKLLKEEYRFSNKIITEFLQPFYAGIFLENELSTSRRMFDFVFKMFSEGEATVPAKGMEEIPKQIASYLDPNKINCNTKVIDVKGNVVHLQNKKPIIADHILVATEADGLCSQFTETKKTYRSTTNLYFYSNEQPYKQNTIALNGDPKAIVNNFVCISKNSRDYSQNKELISVSLKEGVSYDNATVSENVKTELSKWIPSAKKWHHLKTYKIGYALPDQTKITNDNIIKVSNKMTIIGDHVMNGSINAAMKSGRLGAERVIGMS
jgi:protoporphyrinogen oxidase